jgi:hypothetical protein
MAKMGRYCKAYPIPRFREFKGWAENSANARKENDEPRPLTDQDFLYLQENLVVTDGIFLDENIIFDQITSEWTDFCRDALQFEPPDYSSEDGMKSEEPG